jgi:3-deoxy-7-phosphoheptulonate synthase/chorismate mutase
MNNDNLENIRRELVDINYALLQLLSKRGMLVKKVAEIKRHLGMPLYDPQREQQMLQELVGSNRGPFPAAVVSKLFKEIFRASVELMEADSRGELKVALGPRASCCKVRVGEVELGGGEPVVIAGPCAIESETQMETVAGELSRMGVRILRAGAFKPRSSPYSFQGMGEPGLKILQQVCRRYGLASVTEVMDPRQLELVAESADMIQVGARNMHNYSLLREVGRCRKPVLLKRGFAATIDELLWSAEYIFNEGNEQVVLCERGIRTFETQTRNTLDISAVALLRRMSRLPVVVDISHAAGRKDILVPLAKASLAAGAHGLMVEVHPFPQVARSDSQQQLDLEEFGDFLRECHLYQERRINETIGSL